MIGVGCGSIRVARACAGWSATWRCLAGIYGLCEFSWAAFFSEAKRERRAAVEFVR